MPLRCVRHAQPPAPIVLRSDGHLVTVEVPVPVRGDLDERGSGPRRGDGRPAEGRVRALDRLSEVGPETIRRAAKVKPSSRRSASGRGESSASIAAVSPEHSSRPGSASGCCTPTRRRRSRRPVRSICSTSARLGSGCCSCGSTADPKTRCWQRRHRSCAADVDARGSTRRRRH